MPSDPLADLEKRTTAAEEAVAHLKAQVQSLGAGGDEERLRALLKLLHEDRAECEAIRAHRDELKEENGRLKEQIKKYEYRVKHLLRTIEEHCP